MSTLPEKYVKHIKFSQKDAEHFIGLISKLVVWKENCRVLDVGCGPGNVTHDLLLPILPKSATVIAMDYSIDVIRHAKEHYGNSPQVKYLHMDIVSPDPDFAQTFDYIFSLYCLHFIGKQKTALENIYAMLKVEGDFFFTCGVKCEIFRIISTISEMEKWNPHIPNSKAFVSPYQYSENPKEDLEKLLVEVGFEVSFISSEPREYYFSFHTLKDVFLSIRFITIPKNLEEEFQRDLEKVIRGLGYSVMKNGQEFYHTNYQLLLGRATKTNKF